MLRLLGLSGLAFFALTWSGCGPSGQELNRRIEERVQEILSGVPTPTPIAIPTPLPTGTPAPTPTPQPIPTPQPTPTPITFPPTPTPQPTPTPFVLPPPFIPPPTPTPQPLVDLNVVHRGAYASVFWIQAGIGSGSGWLLEPGLILTNQHVVSGASEVTVRQASNPPFPAQVLAVDSLRDIALLKFDASAARLPPRAAPLPLGHITTLDIARPLVALGYSGSGVKADGTVGAAAANVGALSQIIEFGLGSFGQNLVMDTPVDPGDSGGPVLDRYGLVVGMARAVQERAFGGQRMVGTFYAIHVDEIRNALPLLRMGRSR